MNQSIRSRIHVLFRFTTLGALLVAGLVIVASRTPLHQAPATPAATSRIHAVREPATSVVDQAAATPQAPTSSPTQPPAATPASSQTLVPPTPPPDASNRIGVLAGHWGYDSGAICSDGLREVDITVDIARRVAVLLRSMGYEVDILQEHDPDSPQPPLQNYQAAAFVALHADSCLPGVSGFKVARWAFSQMPEMEDRLVQCLNDNYGPITGLARHDDSITIDMWNYYAFREIGELTPGAIVELGFMTDDRWLLVQQPDLAARGIVDGLLCFLNDSDTD